MSYQVLARKWRPKQFTEMVGQGHVLKALINALDDDRLHHAYLFTGTRGVGKTSIARLFAKALNCEHGVSSTPCGECGACVEIAEGRFVDLIEVDAASRTKVEDTRELLENVQYAPSRGRFKVYLIDEVHMLSKSSFNALLKTLEEPPPHVKFLLATTDPQKLPVTVLSRCLQFNLKNMIPQRIVEHLANVLSSEKIAYDEGALWLLARSADGSMRDALSLTDQSIAFGAGSINEADVRVMLGTIDLRLVYSMLSSVIVGDGVTLLQNVENLAQFSPDYPTVLGDITSLLHRIAIAQAVPSALDNSLGDKQQVMELASQLSAEDVQLYYQIALMGRKDLPLVPDAREGLEMTLLRMLAFRPSSSANLTPKNLQHTDEKPNSEALQSTAGFIDAKEGVLNTKREPEPKSHADQQSLDNAQQTGLVNEEINAPSALIGMPTTRDVSKLASSASEATAQLSTANNVYPAAELDEVSRLDVEKDNSETVEQAVNESNDQVISKQVADLPSEQHLQQVVEERVLVDKNIDSPVVKTEMPALQNERAPNEPLPVDYDAQYQYQSNDIPPWEDEPLESAQPLLPTSQVKPDQTTNNAQLEKPNTGSSLNQINISKMLDLPVTTLAQLKLDNWPALVGAVGFTGMTAHIAENLSLEKIDGNRIEFNVSKVQKNVLDSKQKERIQSLLSEYFNCQLQVGYESEQSTRETPWQCFEKLRAKRLSAAISSFQNNEMVKSITAAFAGEVDRSSIMPVD
jgi:DNA polymerase-3 subunit gamma/tau